MSCKTKSPVQVDEFTKDFHHMADNKTTDISMPVVSSNDEQKAIAWSEYLYQMQEPNSEDN